MNKWVLLEHKVFRLTLLIYIMIFLLKMA